MPPLFVLELLQRIVAATEFYLNNAVSEKALTSNLVVLSQLFGEMLDGGFPLVTELNVLQDLIRPPSLLATLTGDSAVKKLLPPGQLTHTHWRRQGVKYTSNGAGAGGPRRAGCSLTAARRRVFPGHHRGGQLHPGPHRLGRYGQHHGAPACGCGV